MMSASRGLQLLRKYRFVIINAVFSGIVGTAVTSVWNTVAPSAAIDQMQLALLVAVALFVAIFAFDIKRSVVSRLDVIEGTVGRIAGRRRRRQYDERRTHHAEEKSLLTEELVVKQLPSLIAGAAFANRDEIAIIVDSGTTLEGDPVKRDGERGADERTNDGNPRVAPISIALIRNRQNCMHDSRGEVARWIDGIASGAAEREADDEYHKPDR